MTKAGHPFIHCRPVLTAKQPNLVQQPAATEVDCGTVPFLLGKLDPEFLDFIRSQNRVYFTRTQYGVGYFDDFDAMTTPTSGATSRIPVTIITGFAGAGKTTLILNLIPQLRAENPGYKLALIKNEIGDLNVDTQLAAAAEMTGSKELLGDCICCTNVGQIESALETLDEECHPDRIIIETSGSAEPLKLVLEVNRIARATGRYELDGVVSVIDAENWGGYANTSYTAKLQAKQTDLIVINKWEGLDERAFDIFLDRLGDLDVDTPHTKSDKGWISKELLFGFDPKLARAWMKIEHQHRHIEFHEHDHKSEMECISVTLTSPDDNNQADENAEVDLTKRRVDENAEVDLKKLASFLKTAPKDEVYRIKAVLYSHYTSKSIDDADTNGAKTSVRSRYILNWSFGRYTWSADDISDPNAPHLRMSLFTAPDESNKWMKRIRLGTFIAISDTHAAVGANPGMLEVKRVQ